MQRATEFTTGYLHPNPNILLLIISDKSRDDPLLFSPYDPSGGVHPGNFQFISELSFTVKLVFLVDTLVLQQRQESIFFVSYPCQICVSVPGSSVRNLYKCF